VTLQFFNTIHWLRSRLKGLPKDMAMALRLPQPPLHHTKGSRILVYHGICKGNPLRFNTLFVQRNTFEKQLQLYKKYFHLVSLDDYYNGKFSEQQFNICLSFDDGFANNYQYVLPLLEKYKVPAVFFVTAIRQTGNDILWNDVLAIANRYGPEKIILENETFSKGRHGRYMAVRTGRLLAETLRQGGTATKMQMMKLLEPCKKKADTDYWLQMNEAQIKEMAKSPWVTIGSHSCYHNDLAYLSAAEAEMDMLQSKQYLEQITGKAITSLAFPYGSYTKETIEIAKKIGYTQLLAAEFLLPNDSDDATMRERLTINPFISSINQLYANVSGHY
jgi:peptidoglycan/xylan/chitin deacetylase (PgdA/CDA1 family)